MNINFKKQIKIINSILNKPNFYYELSEFSKNDLESLIDNLSKIITYYLTIEDQKTYESIEKLFEQINGASLENPPFLIYPTNSYYYNALRLFGLNFTSGMPNLITSFEKRLYDLASEVSFAPVEYDSNVLYSSVKDAIEKSFASPSILFEHILKQPQKKEQPIILGEKESTYYQNILNLRILNVHEMAIKTGAQIGKKAISTFIGKDALLVVIPSNLFDDNSPIPPNLLSFIKIPSRYTLLNICAQNQKLSKGISVDLKKGTIFTPEELVEEPKYLVEYARYENISITDEFTYYNPETTGDIKYDIDLIYGHLDSNNSHAKLLPRFEDNLAKIKKSSDIRVRKVKNKYYISNGRHRLLYLKHYYISHFEAFKKYNKLDDLKKMLTICVNVERAIESDEINSTAGLIKTKFPNSYILKANINNEEPSLIVFIDNYVYHINNAEELNELYSFLLQLDYTNKFLVSQNNPNSHTSTNEIMHRLVIILQEKIFSMDIIDIIQYLKENPLVINNKPINIEEINLRFLYYDYLSLQNIYTLNHLLDLKKDLIEISKSRVELYRIGHIIMNLINDHPEYLDYEWEDLVEILHRIPELESYSSEYLRECAETTDYIKNKYISKIKIHNTKKV